MIIGSFIAQPSPTDASLSARPHTPLIGTVYEELRGFREIGIVRVYTTAPGRPPDRDTPFTVRRGQTVHDVAMLVHRDIAQTLKYARIWGEGHFSGQQVGRDHPVTTEMCWSCTREPRRVSRYALAGLRAVR